MATFTFTKTSNANNLRDNDVIAEQLRRCADEVEKQYNSTIPASYTKTDPAGIVTLYAWTYA